MKSVNDFFEFTPRMAVQVFDLVRVKARLCLQGKQQYKYYGFVVLGAQRIVRSVRLSYLSCLEEQTQYCISISIWYIDVCAKDKTAS
jgi:hypothetical protein